MLHKLLIRFTFKDFFNFKISNFSYRQKKLLEKEKKKAAKLAELREKGLISPSSDWTIDSDTGEPLRKKAKYVFGPPPGAALICLSFAKYGTCQCYNKG